MRLFLVLGFLFAGIPAFADTKTDAMVAYLKGLHQDARFEATLVARGFSGAKLRLSKDFAKRIFTNDTVARFAARRFIRWGETSGIDDIDIVDALYPLIDEGLPHINGNDMKMVLRLRHDTLVAMPEKTCGRLVSGKKVKFDFDGTHARFVARLSAIDLGKLYNAYYDAVMKGLTRPGPPAIGQQLQDEARKKVLRKLEALIAERSDAAELTKALDDINRAGPIASCRLVKLYMQSILSVNGRSKRIALQMFLSD